MNIEFKERTIKLLEDALREAKRAEDLIINDEVIGGGDRTLILAVSNFNRNYASALMDMLT